MNRALKQTRIQIMKQFEKKSLEYRVLKYYWKLIQKDRRKLSPNAFYSRTFRETLTPKECLDKIFKHVPQLKSYYNLLSIISFPLTRKKISNNFFGLIQEALPQLNHPFKIALTTFIRYQKYITNAIKLPILMPNLKQPTNSSKILNVMLLVTGTLTTLKNAFTSL